MIRLDATPTPTGASWRWGKCNGRYPLDGKVSEWQTSRAPEKHGLSGYLLGTLVSIKVGPLT